MAAMARPKLHDEALRARLLGRAAEMLSAGGPDALSLRRLATDVDTSTTAVYSLFGGKAGLLDAVNDEAMRRFVEHLDAAGPTDDPAADLRRLAAAYRRGALRDPHLYRVMFDRRPAGLPPDTLAKERAAATLSPLVDMVRLGIDRGVLAGTDPVQVATALWATVHGLVTLELGELLPPTVADPERLFDDAVRAAVAGWSAG